MDEQEPAKSSAKRDKPAEVACLSEATQIAALNAENTNIPWATKAEVWTDKYKSHRDRQNIVLGALSGRFSVGDSIIPFL